MQTRTALAITALVFIRLLRFGLRVIQHRRLVLQADFGQPNEAFSAFEGSLGEGSFGEGCEVNPDAQRQRQRQSSQEQPISARLQAAAQAILSAAKVGPARSADALATGI